MKKSVLRKWEIAVIFGIVFTMIMSMVSFGAECDKIKSDVLRLHILANSDSNEDQALKIKVRDAVLSEWGNVLCGADSIDEAKKMAGENIEGIKKTALRVIEESGLKYDITVAVNKAYFSTRHYEEYTLPAGRYDAVQIKIGKAQGHNWWCVMYPSICIAASSNYNEALDEGEKDVIENYQKYEIKFKTVEVFEKIVKFLQENM